MTTRAATIINTAEPIAAPIIRVIELDPRLVSPTAAAKNK